MAFTQTQYNNRAFRLTPEKVAAAAEVAGTWITVVSVLVIIPFRISVLPFVLSTAFGTGSLLTASAMLALSSIPACRTTLHLAVIFLFTIAAAITQGFIIEGATAQAANAANATATPTLSWGSPQTVTVLATLAIFSLVAASRTRYVLTQPTAGFGEQN